MNLIVAECSSSTGLGSSTDVQEVQRKVSTSPSIVLVRRGCGRIDSVEGALSSTPGDAAIIGLGVG